MPILGYAGYLPFGLECIVVAEMVLGSSEKDKISNVEQRISNDEV
jgi:hypothetical protein